MNECVYMFITRVFISTLFNVFLTFFKFFGNDQVICKNTVSKSKSN